MSASLLRLGGWRSVGALVVVAAAATGIGQTGVGHALLERAGLTQRPAGYTALSFTAPDVPVKVGSAGKRAHSYSLTVNIRNTNTTSRYYLLSLLLAQRPGQARRIRTRTALVGPRKAVSISQKGTFDCERGRPVEFIVQLAGRDTHEAIHAWASCRRPGG
jgi:hypothetical protein